MQLRPLAAHDASFASFHQLSTPRSMVHEAQKEPERPSTSCAPRVLTAEIVRQHLSILGKNPYSLAFVFTTATLTQLELEDLEAIGDFPHLQHIVCSKNELRSLSPLRELKLLLSVDASHNQLTQVLDFDIPRCTSKNAWVGGGEWIGSLLRRADLSYNRITSIRDLSVAHPFLQELHLAHNDIHDIHGISALRFLRVLDLSHNRLSSTKGLVATASLEPEAAGLDALEVLRLSHNQITFIDDVTGLPRLSELDVAHNKLRQVNCLEHCIRLQKLDLSFNELASVNELNYLVPLPFLQKLVLIGNPLVQQEGSPVFYRARVLRRLQQLVELDDEDVSAKEKIKALTMHGSEVASRKAVLATYLPTEDFVNYLPSLDFEEDAELLTFYEERYGQAPTGSTHEQASGTA